MTMAAMMAAKTMRPAIKRNIRRLFLAAFTEAICRGVRKIMKRRKWGKRKKKKKKIDFTAGLVGYMKDEFIDVPVPANMGLMNMCC